MRREALPADALLAFDAGCVAHPVVRAARFGEPLPCEDMLVEEVPIALVYNGISHAVMLASPLDLEDFAVGFSLTEGLVQHVGEVYEIEVVAGHHGTEVRLTVASSRMNALKERRRALAGRTGCGLCGIESLQQLARSPAPVETGGSVSFSGLRRAIATITKLQPLHRSTGAAHAAGWATWDGAVALVREDVGRHNALDKLIGALARGDIDARLGFAVVTSRASYEMVQKAASVGIPVLAALSAPTAMAARLAGSTGLTLIGFAGRDHPVLYAHPGRFIADAAVQPGMGVRHPTVGLPSLSAA